MSKLERQIELQVSELHVRETGDGKKSRTVEGYAMLFGVRSLNLTPWSNEREVYEIMEPGCITPDLLSRSDVVLTAFHNNQLILGRWRKGNGTLSLEIDQRGLKIRCTLAETATADELLSAIERGDISGMSFAFTADEEDSVNGVSYEKTGEKVLFKPAGGVSTTEDAVKHYTLVKEILGEDWLNNESFRFGASRLANNLLSSIVGKEVKYF